MDECRLRHKPDAAPAMLCRPMTFSSGAICRYVSLGSRAPYRWPY